MESLNFDSVLQLISNALIKRASLKMQQAKDTECFADFSQAINIDKENADIYHHRGQVSSSSLFLKICIQLRLLQNKLLDALHRRYHEEQNSVGGLASRFL